MKLKKKIIIIIIVESQIGYLDKFATRNTKKYVIKNLDKNLTNE